MVVVVVGGVAGGTLPCCREAGGCYILTDPFVSGAARLGGPGPCSLEVGSGLKLPILPPTLFLLGHLLLDV